MCGHPCVAVGQLRHLAFPIDLGYEPPGWCRVRGEGPADVARCAIYCGGEGAESYGAAADEVMEGGKVDVIELGREMLDDGEDW